MYTIVGGDGQQYGPVDADQLRRWVAEGRANGRTLVQKEGGPWQPLSTYAEFAELAPVPPTVEGTPPPIAPPAASTAGTSLPRTNGTATAALILSALGLVCCGPLFSTIGLILAIVAIAQINRDPAREVGKNLAIAAIVIALLGHLLRGRLPPESYRGPFREAETRPVLIKLSVRVIEHTG